MAITAESSVTQAISLLKLAPIQGGVWRTMGGSRKHDIRRHAATGSLDQRPEQRPTTEQSGTVMIGLRVPVELRMQLEERAAANHRNLSQECERALERSFSPEALFVDCVRAMEGPDAHKKVADLGGTIETLDINTKVHMVADEDHSDMFEPIFDRHVVDERAAQAVIRAARDSLAVDRSYRSALATAMARIAESQVS